MWFGILTETSRSRIFSLSPCLPTHLSCCCLAVDADSAPEFASAMADAEMWPALMLLPTVDPCVPPEAVCASVPPMTISGCEEDSGGEDGRRVSIAGCEFGKSCFAKREERGCHAKAQRSVAHRSFASQQALM